MQSNPQRHRLTTSRYFTAPFNKAPLSPSRRRVCSNAHLQQFTAPSELHAPPLLQPAAAPLGKSALIPHRLTLTLSALYASLPPPEAATLHHSPRSPPLLHVQATGRYYNFTATLRPDAAPFNNLAVLPPDASAPAPTFIFRTNLRSCPHDDHAQQRRPLDDTQQHRFATQHRRRPIPPLPPYRCVSSARLSHHQKLLLSTNLLQHSPLPASSECALHWPSSVATLSDTTLRSTPDSRCPRSPLLPVQHTTGEHSCTVLQ